MDLESLRLYHRIVIMLESVRGLLLRNDGGVNCLERTVYEFPSSANSGDYFFPWASIAGMGISAGLNIKGSLRIAFAYRRPAVDCP